MLWNLTNLLISLFFRPTCKECTRVFPEACFNELRSYYDKSVIEKYQDIVTNRKQIRERLARQYCYLTYFGPVLGEDINAMIPKWSSVLEKNAEDKSSDEDESRRSDDDDSSRKDDDDDDDDDGSSSRRRLLSTKLPFRNRLTPAMMENFMNLENAGSLSCPAPQCLTNHDELLESLVAPWYHASGAGVCSFNDCSTNANSGPEWCRAAAGNCIKCKGTWCPPKAVPFWSKVTAASYEPLLPFYEDIDIAKRFPRSACNYQPLTQISQTEARGLPWYDLAGDVFGIKPRTLSPSLKKAVQDTRDENNADLIAEYEKQQAIKEEKRRIAEENARRAEEKREIHDRIEALKKARAAEVKRQQEAAEMARQAAAAAAARKRMEEEEKLRKEQEAAQNREIESAARQYCYDRYISEAAKYGGFSIGGGLEAIDGDSDSEGSMKYFLEEMEMNGNLTCPPAECYFEDVVEEVADDERSSFMPKTMPGDLEIKSDNNGRSWSQIDWETRSLLPWYYQTSDGYCTWSGGCDSSNVAKGWCGKSASSCVSCDEVFPPTWCPPVSGQSGWMPVTKQTYLKFGEAMELVEEPVVLIGGGADGDMVQGDSVSNNATNSSYAGDAEMTEDDDTEDAKAERPMMLFNYRKCTNSSVIGLPMEAVSDLYWPGMIDFTAAIARQRGGFSSLQGYKPTSVPRRAVRGGPFR